MVLLIAGVAIVALVGWRYVDGGRTRAAARTAWVQIGAAAHSDTSQLPTPQAGDPVARVTVPRLGIDEVVLEGVSATELNAAPGHHPGSPLPGFPGNSVVSAHRDRQFFPLGRAELGDTVVTETLGLGTRRWRIVGRRIAPADSAYVLPTETPMLTLTTCWPIRYIGPAPDRLLLTAELIVDS